MIPVISSTPSGAFTVGLSGSSGFGITSKEFIRMEEEQHYACAICRTIDCSTNSMDVDHCHETGEIRGLLCRSCNLALGLLKDDSKRLISMQVYLKRAQKKATFSLSGDLSTTVLS